MTNNIYDCAIVGAGVAGMFAALKISKEHKNLKTVLFDLGRPVGKRRAQVFGAGGLLPNSDGKFFQNNIKKVAELTGIRKVKAANTWITDYLSDLMEFNIIEDKKPSINATKRIKKNEYEMKLNNYIQIYPKDIHIVLRHINNILQNNKNMTMNFDDEVFSIVKQKNNFVIVSQAGQFTCKKLIMCVGRGGWRWAQSFYASMGIIENNDFAKFGIKIEMPDTTMKDFNHSACELKKDDIEVGPFSWDGTVIPEDHTDMAIAAFRSNENRWHSDKVSFSLIGERYFKNGGFEQADRLAKLTWILSNDRVAKEKVSNIVNKKSKLSIIPEYDWLIDAIKDLNNVIPELISKAYFHAPLIVPLAPKINIGSDLSTEIKGLYIAGESSGIVGLLSAALMGTIAGDSIEK